MLCCVGGTPQIQRANADEFIHIFVNNSKKLTEFLEHMVKVVALSQFYWSVWVTAFIRSYTCFLDVCIGNIVAKISFEVQLYSFVFACSTISSFQVCVK